MQHTVKKPRRRERIINPKVVDRRSQVWEGLLAAAGRLMADSGIAAVSVEQILLAAGVSRGTFYGFCSGKSDLVAAIIEPVLVEGTATLARLESEPPPRIVPAIVDLYADLWRRHRNALLMIPGVDADAFLRLREAHKGYTDAMHRALERAAAAGTLRNGSASHSFRVLSRTAVPLLRVYQDHPDGKRLYRESMVSLLAGSPCDFPVYPGDGGQQSIRADHTGDSTMTVFRVLVADKVKARLYELPSRRGSLKPLRSFVNPDGRKHERALGTGRPGRVTSGTGGRRHAYQAKHGLKEHSEEVFVRRVATALAKDASASDGAPILLIAAPQLLGAYRKHLPANVRDLVVMEIRLDLGKETDIELSKRVRAALMDLPFSVTTAFGSPRRSGK
ncbi:MAG: host attachment protein [Gammaproteobacteria bacterium]